MFNILFSLHNDLFGVAVTLPTAILTSIAASRLSMNIRAITVERGIATLANQSRLSSLLPSRSRDRGVGEIGPSSVNGNSSPTGIPARQGEEEFEGGDDDDDDNGARFEERDEDEDEEIIQEDRSMTRASGKDVERAIDH